MIDGSGWNVSKVWSGSFLVAGPLLRGPGRFHPLVSETLAWASLSRWTYPRQFASAYEPLEQSQASAYLGSNNWADYAALADLHRGRIVIAKYVTLLVVLSRRITSIHQV